MHILRPALVAVATTALLAATATPAGACAGLVNPGGTVRLLRTATLAGYANGIEHYVTSFQFEGGGAEFGSIVPLPGVPTKVERGGDWTLARLQREVAPPVVATGAGTALASTSGDAQVLYETRIDALDITVLKGGGNSVGVWAKKHGFKLTPDAPEVLDFYAKRSQIFMAARFNAKAAKDRGQTVGDGTPIHLTIPTDNPWVPLRILGLGLPSDKKIEADVFLITARKPALLPVRAPGVVLQRREPASKSLLDDLRTDKGGSWVPRSGWLTYLTIDSNRRDLFFDLATDVSGKGQPSYVAAGLRDPAPVVVPKPTPTPAPSLTAAPTPSAEPAPSEAPVVLAEPRASDRDATVPIGIAVALLATTGLALVVRKRQSG